MSRSSSRLAAAALCAAIAAAPAWADPGLDEVALLAGIFDVGESAAVFEAGAEARFTPFLSGERPVSWRLALAAGAIVTGDDGAYGWGGFRLELPLGDRFSLVPHVGAGLYDRGDGKDLGGAIQFRSGLEGAWLLTPRMRLGLVYYHLSNAGLERPNPGSESLSLVWAGSF